MPEARSRSPSRRPAARRGRVEGRVAVVTGGASGIGAAVCQRLAEEGARVVIADIDRERGEALAARLGGPGAAKYQHTDVTKEESIKACMDAAVAAFGGLHILVNNAVWFCFGHLVGQGQGSGTGTDRDITAEDWAKVFSTNVVGYATCMKHAVAKMRDNTLSEQVFLNDQGEGVSRIDAGSRGAIVNIASISSYIAQPEFVPYNCSKGGVLQLTKCCAMDFAPLKVRVNAVCPGSIETPGSYGHMRLLGLPLDEGRKKFGDIAPLKRQGAPEEIANVAVFLASDDASFMTGAHLVVDGGLTI